MGELKKFGKDNPNLTIRVERPAHEESWWCFILEPFEQGHHQTKASHIAEDPDEAAHEAIRKYHEDERKHHEDEDRLITDLRKL